MPKTTAKTDTSALIYARTNRGVNLTKFPPVNSSEGSDNKVFIAFDWIEYTGLKTENFLSESWNRSRTEFDLNVFQVVDTVHDFKKVIEWRIGNKWEKVAELTTDLKAGIDKQWCKLKLENKFCYQHEKQTLDLLRSLNDHLGIKFKNYTRLDVAADLQLLVNTKLSPGDFMGKIARQDFKFGRKRMRVTRSKKKTTATENRGDVEAVDYVQFVAGSKEIMTIRVGSRQSGMSISMYNKSAEMRAVTDKPYIREQWQRIGFDENKDTYRIEFQHMKDVNTYKIYNEDLSLKCTIDHSDIETILHLQDYYVWLYNTHFCVYKNKAGETHLTRMKRLFVLPLSVYKLYEKQRHSNKQKSTNYEKVGLVKLLNAALYEQRHGSKLKGAILLDHASGIIATHDLYRYVDRKFPDLHIKQQHSTIEDLIMLDNMKDLHLRQRAMIMA